MNRITCYGRTFGHRNRYDGTYRQSNPSSNTTIRRSRQQQCYHPIRYKRHWSERRQQQQQQQRMMIMTQRNHYSSLGHHFDTFSTNWGRFSTQTGRYSSTTARMGDRPIDTDDTSVRFTSIASSTTTSTELSNKMRQVTNDLLNPNTTISIDDPTVWKQLEDVLRLWMTTTTTPTSQQRWYSPLISTINSPTDGDNDTVQVQNNKNDDESVRYCIQLMDKFASTLPQDTLLFVSILETDLLNTILSRWRTTILQQQSATATVQRRNNRVQAVVTTNTAQQHQLKVWSPSTMAEKLEQYRWSGLVQPDARSYNLILHTMMKIEGVHVADQYLRSLLQAAVQQEIAMQQATGISPSMGNKNRSSSSSSSNATESQQHQQQQQQQLPLPPMPLPPMADIVSVNTVMKGWVDSKRPEMAQKWLDRIVELRGSSSTGGSSHGHKYTTTTTTTPTMLIRPDSITYSTVIHGWAKQGNAQQAEFVLQQQIDDYYLHGNHTAQPDRILFHTVLDGWAKATSLLVADKRRHNNNNYNSSSSNNNSNNNNNSSGSLSIQQNAPARARTLVRQMKDLMLSPNMETTSKLLVVLAQSPNEDINDAVNMLIEAEEEFKQRASIMSYNRFLHAYAQRGLPEEAEVFLLDRLLRGEGPSLSAGGNTSNRVSHNPNKDILRPNTVSFNCVLAAWAAMAECRPEAVVKCEEWIRRMGTDYGVLPSVQSYATYLKAWSLSTRHYDNAAEQAEHIFRTVLGEVVDAYYRRDQAKSPTTGSARSSRMSSTNTSTTTESSSFIDPESFDAEGIGVCFTTVLNAWDNQAKAFRRQKDEANSRRSGVRAMQFFHDFFDQRYQQQLPPSIRSYRHSHSMFQTALHIIAGSGLANKHTQTQNVLKIMRQYGIVPTKQDWLLINRLTNRNKQKTGTAAATTASSK